MHPIVIENVSKAFRRRAMQNPLRALARRCRKRDAAAGRAEPFWALRDVSFTAAAGEALGIIGPNGAGKSTLLKIIAGILRPQQGAVRLASRATALIELGAGFHGELTGRENILLNARILGMSRRDTRRKFDDIVAFAEIGEFLDTPVKRYSNGMFARLGFAIAIHVEPRILLVDEVLSVGDRAFRAKCMERMNELLRAGATVVFVSHDVDAVQRFCQRTLVLDAGRAAFLGPGAAAVRAYFDACQAAGASAARRTADLATFDQVRVADAEGRGGPFRPGDAARLECRATWDDPPAAIRLTVARGDDRLPLFHVDAAVPPPATTQRGRADRMNVRFEFRLNVPPGEYVVTLSTQDGRQSVDESCSADVARLIVAGVPEGTGLVHVEPRIYVTGDSQSPSSRTPRRAISEITVQTAKGARASMPCRAD
ncbi:MAG: ABC transporter ATP-binding protein [Phycisphaerae bacterium]|nr:ABC transporter ATP-binding protein [Phycisphaerae bacterium]